LIESEEVKAKGKTRGEFRLKMNRKVWDGNQFLDASFTRLGSDLPGSDWMPGELFAALLRYI